MNTPSTEQMLFAALEALKQGDTLPWPAMFHEDGVMEFPFAPPGYPPRVAGRAAIADYIRSYPERISIRRIIPGAVYHCDSVTVVEFSCHSTIIATGVQFEMSYVAIITVEQGKVKRYRDYWNPLVAVQAMGGLEALLSKGPGGPAQ